MQHSGLMPKSVTPIARRLPGTSGRELESGKPRPSPGSSGIWEQFKKTPSSRPSILEGLNPTDGVVRVRQPIRASRPSPRLVPSLDVSTSLSSACTATAHLPNTWSSPTDPRAPTPTGLGGIGRYRQIGSVARPTIYPPSARLLGVGQPSYRDNVSSVRPAYFTPFHPASTQSRFVALASHDLLARALFTPASDGRLTRPTTRKRLLPHSLFSADAPTSASSGPMRGSLESLACSSALFEAGRLQDWQLTNQSHQTLPRFRTPPYQTAQNSLRLPVPSSWDVEMGSLLDHMHGGPQWYSVRSRPTARTLPSGWMKANPRLMGTTKKGSRADESEKTDADDVDEEASEDSECADDDDDDDDDEVVLKAEEAEMLNFGQLVTFEPKRSGVMIVEEQEDDNYDKDSETVAVESEEEATERCRETGVCIEEVIEAVDEDETCRRAYRESMSRRSRGEAHVHLSRRMSKCRLIVDSGSSTKGCQTEDFFHLASATVESGGPVEDRPAGNERHPPDAASPADQLLASTESRHDTGLEADKTTTGRRRPVSMSSPSPSPLPSPSSARRSRLSSEMLTSARSLPLTKLIEPKSLQKRHLQSPISRFILGRKEKI